NAFKLQKPYILAIIELEEGPRVTGQIVDAEPNEVYIGMPVRMVFRRIRQEGASGIIHYGYKFAPR
ncbi:MAG TPA: transcriptional regulator, partial [Aciduliprofundum sp.]|nr:transcriptional regulator [Aciduliprofundum sp.]